MEPGSNSGPPIFASWVNESPTGVDESDSSSSSSASISSASSVSDEDEYPPGIDLVWSQVREKPMSAKEKWIEDIKTRKENERLFSNRDKAKYLKEAYKGDDCNMYRYFSNKKVYDYTKFNGISILYLAAFYGYDHFLAYLLERFQMDVGIINQAHISGQTILTLACHHNCEISIRYLLTHYPGLDLTSNRFRKVSKSDRKEKDRREEDRKKEVDKDDDEDEEDDDETLEDRINDIAMDQAFERNPNGKWTIDQVHKILPLYHLCIHSQDELAQLYLNHPAFNVEWICREYLNPSKYSISRLINLGAYYGMTDTVLLLIERYPEWIDIDSINQIKKSQFNALISACTNKMESVIEALIRLPGIDLNVKHQGKTPFYLCCRHGVEKMAMRFLEMGPEAGIEIDSPCGRSEYNPFYYACRAEMTAVAHKILDKMESNGVPIQLTTTFSEGSALILCCKEKMEYSLIDRILSLPHITPEYLNAYDMHRQTALNYACKTMSEKLVLRMLEIPGLNVYYIDAKKRDVLYYAIKGHMKKVVRWFVDQRKIPYTPGSHSIIQTLIQKKWIDGLGADMDKPIVKGEGGGIVPRVLWPGPQVEEGGKKEDCKCNICFDYEYQDESQVPKSLEVEEEGEEGKEEEGGEEAEEEKVEEEVENPFDREIAEIIQKKRENTYFIKCRSCVATYHNHCLYDYYKKNIHPHHGNPNNNIKCCCCRNSGFCYM
jgi:ankyrin repeat protein